MNMHRDVVRWLLTPTLALRAILTTLLVSIGSVVLPSPTGVRRDGGPENAALRKPGQLVDIGGRRINMLCAGSGCPTVILMAGYSVGRWSGTKPSP